MTLTLERVIPAPPRDVFEAWLDPGALARFMCPAKGGTVSTVEVDARVGGAFLIVMVVGTSELPHRGEYLAIDRYARLAFTWRSPHAGEESQVTLRFEPVGDGETRLILEHVGLGDADNVRRHESGWSHILAELVEVVATPVTQ